MRNLILLLFMVLLPVCSYSKEYSYCEEDESTYANIPPFRGLRWQYSAPIWATASDPSADLGLEWRDISTAFKYIEEGNTITRITAMFTNANIDGLIESTNTIYNGYLEALWEPLNCENITPCQWILNYYENVECFYYQVEESVPAPSIIYFKIKDDKYVFNHKTSYVWVNLLLDWPDRYNHSEAYGLKYYLDEDLIRSSPGPGFDYWTLKIKDRLSPKIYTLKVDVWWLYETNVVSTKSFQIEILGDCPKITNFTGSNAIIDPYSGGSVSFTYSVDKTFDSADITINGESIETTWDGKLNGKLVEPGTYSALLTVKKGDCTVTASTPVKVEGFVGCPLLVTVGSSANIASGSLTDSLSLFSIPGSSPNMAFALNYNSLDAINNSLGIGWSHSFDIFLTRNASGEVTLHEGNGRRRLYTPSGNGYASQSGDHSTLAKNLDGTFLLTRKNGMEYLFTSQGKITAVIDRSGNILTFVYSDGLLSKVNDSVGHSIIFSYDGHGNLVSLADSAGNVYSFTVSGDTLTDVIFPGGATWNYSYDEQAFLTAKIDPLGNLTTYDYDDLHRLVGSIDPEGQVRSLEYPVTEESERTTTFTEKDGGQWHYTYDTNAGDLLTKTDPQGNVTQYSYDNQHNLLSKTEPGLGTSYYGYDSNGNRVSVTDADGNVTEYTYNDYGQMTSVTNPSHKTTTYTYDTNGNLTKVTDPSGSSSIYTYDSQGRLTSSTNATGQSTTLAYDEQGNVASVTGVDGATTFFTYDANGNRLSMTDALGNVTRYEYDVMGRLEKVTDARGNATKYEYDTNGNRTSVTDANGKKTIFDYNFEHQMTSMTDAMGYTTHFTYGGSTGCSSCGGGVDKLTSLTDAKGQSTLFQYNALGKLMTQTDPLGHQTNYGYDAAGHVASKTDPNGNTIQYTYDNQGQLTSKTFPDGTRTVFNYDLEGNLLSAGNQHIIYNYTYDASNRLTSTIDSYGIQVKYTYDPAGNRTSLSSSNGIEITYTYDDAGRLTQIGSQAGYVIFGYGDLNRRATLGFPNGVKTTYDYDDLGRLTDLVTSSSSSIIAENHYAHDKIGNRLSNRDALHTMNYIYDDDYRLTLAQSNTPGNSPAKCKNKAAANPTTIQSEFYNYDAVGNRTTSSEHNTYSYNFGNELLHTDSVSYTYDANGNRTSKTDESGTTIYAWDYENRLTRVTLPDSSTVTFTYDPFGRRISKTANGITTTYTYDNEDILFEAKDGAIDNFYIHGPGIDEPLALVSKRGASYYHADGLGSIVALTDDQARNVQQYEYDSFGNQHDMKNRIKQPYGYTGREHDRETGLRYYRARYYDGEVGRFISEDPIGFAGGDVNLYVYVGENPTSWIDPIGQYGIDIHYNLTKHLAIKAGFWKSEGIAIANANQHVDDNPATDPMPTILGGGNSSSDFGYSARSNYHFATNSRVRELLNLSYSSCDLESLGIALHVYQDSYSHEGFSPALGHVLAGTAPDEVQRQENWGNLEKMSKGTAEILRLFKEKCSCEN